ncbi:uncharacterized protein LOC126571164 [Anopheles aquasalis]|uniref:uncharacterized protein LOC126571164 n=1 Tax=Anopheles aquasalis TaxID=42839 RepID=UPI00215B6485|nr:uncharacterized protein LOC126571164 [Anopheles aquasalis]XP_050085430.1 uncharacterized protein LOC126571164 [Anopheles aquasalis]
MTRIIGSAAVYLLLFQYSKLSTMVWCYNVDLLHSARNPLDPPFRSPQTPYGQKHSKSTPGSYGNGISSAHRGLAFSQQAPSYQQSFIPTVVESLPLHPRWQTDQRKNPPAALQVPPIPVIHMDDIGVEDNFVDHEGRPLLDSLEIPSSLDQSPSKESSDNPMLLQILRTNHRLPPRELTLDEQDNDVQSVVVKDDGRRDRAVESIDLIREQLERIKQEEDIETKSNLLTKLLTELPEGPLPIVYVEDAAGTGLEAEEDDDEDDDVTHLFTPNGGKRSGRYNRGYPWKRQNARNRPYDDARFLCVPSRDDVFKLLIGLHENRNGNHQQKTISFCNRKRPARAIFTNIRFLG